MYRLTIEGYITFLDIPKKSAKEALEKLHSLNVQTKIITGDNEIITNESAMKSASLLNKSP